MPTAHELISRASAMVPRLRERSELMDRLGRLDDQTLQDMVDAEIFKATVPARLGGLQMDWTVYYQLLEAIGLGCGSAGLVVNAYLGALWLVAAFPDEVQHEVFGDKGYALACGPLSPRNGRARKVAGGYKATLQAPFGSGSYHSEWAIVGAMLEPESGATQAQPKALMLLLPRKDYKFDLSSWSVLGVRGSSSATITAEDIFVPEHHAMEMSALRDGSAPGFRLNDAPLYRTPFLSALALAGNGVLIGLARQGLETFEDYVRSRVYARTGQSQSHSVGTQMRVAEATGYIGAADSLMHFDIRRMLDGVENDTLSLDDRGRFRLDAAYAALLCRQAIDCIKDASGANALRDGSPIQRVYRDIHMICGNFGLQIDHWKEIYGRMRLGLPVDVNGI